MIGRHVDYAELQRRRTASRVIRELQLPPGVVCVPYGPGEWETYSARNGCRVVATGNELAAQTDELLERWTMLLALAPNHGERKLWLTAAGRPFIVWTADGITYTLLGKSADTPRVVGVGW